MAKKILVIDDNECMRDSLVDILEMDYEIFSAEDGIAGMDMIERIAPDLVISDLEMPRANGRRVLKYVTTNHPEIKIIIMTACSSEDQKILCESFLTLGANAFFVKPFEPDELMAKIKELLGE